MLYRIAFIQHILFALAVFHSLWHFLLIFAPLVRIYENLLSGVDGLIAGPVSHKLAG